MLFAYTPSLRSLFPDIRLDSIVSSPIFFVSGTNSLVKIKPTTHIAEKMQNIALIPSFGSTCGKAAPIAELYVQLAAIVSIIP